MFVLPIISPLVKHLQKEEIKLGKEQGSVKQTVKKFCSTLIHKLNNKFQLDPINPTSVLALAAAFDPRSHGLTYLPNNNSHVALKVELLKHLSCWSTDHSSTNESEDANPPPSKKKKNSKDKGYVLDFFFGSDNSNTECP